MKLLILAAATFAIAGCAMPEDRPQNAIAVDCHGATQPCGVTLVEVNRQDGARAMDSATVPVSALPNIP
jgi:hypothetical protein